MIIRIGIFATFLGHGLLALSVNAKWIPLLTYYGFSVNQAMAIMPFIGMLDLFVAVTVLVYPVRIVLLWAALWAFATAFTRPLAGEGIIEFVERAANWSLPLTLLLLQGFPRSVKSLFTITDRKPNAKKNRPRVRTV